MRPLVVSISGGRTSALMARFLQEKYQARDIVYLFANTGKEREETLRFLNECDQRWGLGVVWLEADIKIDSHNTTRIVDFVTASRAGEPFEAMIKKYGLPNKSFPHCTRELKERTINRYVKSILGWKDYETAIGIRYDERHRISESKRESGFVYPLCDDIQMTKSIVNAWWDRQPFNLNLKDYEGNCDFCWKKSRRKRLTLISEGLDISQWEKWESESGYVFDRDGHSIESLKAMSNRKFHLAQDTNELKKMNPSLFDNMDLDMECFCKST